jgi:hypothetical protein
MKTCKEDNSEMRGYEVEAKIYRKTVEAALCKAHG